MVVVEAAYVGSPFVVPDPSLVIMVSSMDSSSPVVSPSAEHSMVGVGIMVSDL